MPKELSARAVAMLTRSQSRQASISWIGPYTRGEIVEALGEAGCPSFEPFIDYLIRFSGHCYEVRGDASIVLLPYPARRHLSLKDIVQDRSKSPHGVDWSLGFGEHETAQSLYEMDESGVVLFFEAPAHASVETMLESHSLTDHLRDDRSAWLWARGSIHADAVDVLDERLELPRVAEASDDWNTWWLDADVLAHRFLSFEVDRRESLWVYARTSAAMGRILARLHDVYSGTVAVESS